MFTVKMMKIVAALTLLALTSVFAHDKDELASITKECAITTKVTEEMIRNHKPGGDKPAEELLCFIKCSFEKMGYVQPDGTLLVNDIKKDKMADGTEERLAKVYKCLEELEGVKECDDAWAMEECFNIDL